MDKHFIHGQITKADDASEYDATFTLTTQDMDRDGDIILADAWDFTNFLKNPRALWMHKADQIVGSWANLRRVADTWVADLKLATTALGQMAKTLIDEGHLTAVSVGFRPSGPNAAEPIEGKGWLFKSVELLETSLVSVPANPNALAVAKSLGLDPHQIFEHVPTQASGKSADPATLERARALIAKSGKTTPKPTPSNGSKDMNLSDKILAKQQEVTTLADELTKAADQYAEDPTDELQETVDAFTEKLEATRKQLDTLQGIEDKLKAAAVPPSSERPQAPGVIRSRKDYEPGELIFRKAAATLISHVTQRSVDAVLRERFKGDVGLDAIIKADATPATTGVDAWAGHLLGEQVAGFVDLLANNSVYGALRAAGVGVSFDGANSVVFPGRSTTKKPAGGFVGEGAPIPVKEASLSAKTLVPHAMKVISTMSREIVRQSNGQIEAIVRDAIINDTQEVLDGALLDNAAASAVRSAGLQNGVTPTASSGTTVENIITDLKALMATFTTDDAAKNIVLIMNTQRRLGMSYAMNALGQMVFQGDSNPMGMTIVNSANVAADEVIAVNAGDFATAYGAPEFEISNSATLHMEDTSPDVIKDGATEADPVRSLFQTDTLGIRMVMDVSWIMRRDAQVAALSGVAW